MLEFCARGDDGATAIEFLPEDIGRKSYSAARMFFFRQAVQICSERDLSFYFFLAVPEIVVGDECHHHASRITACNLECAPIVVSLVWIAPAHAVAPLAFRSCIEMGKAEVLLLHPHQMRRKDHAPGMPGPVSSVKRGIVLREVWVASIAEDPFDKIEIADEASGGEEPDLHRFRSCGTGTGANQGAQQERDERAAFDRLSRSEWQPH
jgi:hypothetical protein